MGLVDSLIGLLVAVIIIYVGAIVIWSLNPIFAIFFAIIAILIAARAVARGDTEGL